MDGVLSSEWDFDITGEIGCDRVKHDEHRKREEGSTQTPVTYSALLVTSACVRHSQFGYDCHDCVTSFLLRWKLYCSYKGSETLSVHVLNYS